MKSLRGSKGIELAELDLFALALFAGLLAFIFRRSEKWMHQHVFKVGWLLSRNNKTTVIFYYTAFLPGVLLHELIAWLIAGVCNVRATRAVQLPQEEQIDALQLGFVRIANVVHPLKRLTIELVPLCVALFVLWHIAIDILGLSSAWTLAASGNLDDVFLAISRVTSTADFWLWFYLAFTIANTMMPDLPAALKGRKGLSLAIGAALLVSIVLGVGDFRSSIITASVESLLSSLTIVLLAIMCANVVMVLGLGAIEATIERLTGHSATFVDGKLTTRTRQEARQLRETEQRRRSRQPAPPTPVAPPKSIYALPLPIPGPPGIEPVSRNIAAILDLKSSSSGQHPMGSESGAGRDKPNAIREKTSTPRSRVAEEQPITIVPPRMLGTAANPSAEKAAESAQSAEFPGANEPALDARHLSDERAPFDRPFAGEALESFDDEESLALDAPDTGFARPFSAPHGSYTSTERRADSSALDQDSSATSVDAEKVDAKPVSTTGDHPSASTKPVPKPSQKSNASGRNASKPVEDDELRYEPLDDGEFYDYDAAADDSS